MYFHGKAMCGYDSTVKWEHCDAVGLASGVNTEFRRSVEPTFRNPSYLQHPLHMILQRFHLGYGGHENLTQSLRDCQPHLILPCSSYCQCVGPALSSTKMTGFPSCCLLEVARNTTLRFASKDCSMCGLQNAADLSPTSQGLQSVGQMEMEIHMEILVLDLPSLLLPKSLFVFYYHLDDVLTPSL